MALDCKRKFLKIVSRYILYYFFFPLADLKTLDKLVCCSSQLKLKKLKKRMVLPKDVKLKRSCFVVRNKRKSGENNFWMKHWLPPPLKTDL
jgi:hypothetical protein